jgi:hypothetical protein
MKVSQKLQVARNLVAQGWAAGTFASLGIDGRRKYCASGALNKAFLGSATSDAKIWPDDELRLAQWLVAEAMYGPLLVGTDPTAVRVAICRWNDSQSGRHAQARVVAAFDAAIAECKRLEDDAEKTLAEEFTTILSVTQGESRLRRDPTLPITGAPARANHTHRSHGRHRARHLGRADRPHRANYAHTRYRRHLSGACNPSVQQVSKVSAHGTPSLARHTHRANFEANVAQADQGGWRAPDPAAPVPLLLR